MRIIGSRSWKSVLLWGILITLNVNGFADRAFAQTRGETDAFNEFEERISTLEPEFAADLLLRLAAGAELSPAKQHELIVRAALLARSAQEPVRRVLVPIDPAGVDPRDAARGAGYTSGLDTQSLQARAIQQLIQIGRREEAAAVLREASREDEFCSCDESFCSVSFPYYQALRLMLEQGYSAEQRGHTERLTQITLEIGRLKTLSQIGPFLELLASIELNSGELASTVPGLRRSLASVGGDGRTLPLFANAISNGIKNLAQRMASKGVAPDDLVDGYRELLKAQLAAAPCSGGEKPLAAAKDKLRADFNATIRTLATQPIPEVKASDVVPAALPRRELPAEYRRSPEAQELLADITSLLAKSKQAEANNQADVDWENAAGKLLSRIDTWTDANDADNSYVEFQRAHFYFMMAKSAPSGSSVASDASRRFVHALARYDLQSAKRLPWFVLLRLALDHIKTLPPSERDDWIERLASAGNTTIRLYIELPKVIESGVERPSTLDPVRH